METEKSAAAQEKIYLVRAFGDRNPYAGAHRKAKDMVSVGWPDSPFIKNLNSLSDYGKDIGKISGGKGVFGKANADFECFMRMEPGDIVLVPDGDEAHICRVCSGPFFNASEKDGYPVARKAVFLGRVNRNQFPPGLREELGNGKLTANLSQYRKEISGMTKQSKCALRPET